MRAGGTKELESSVNPQAGKPAPRCEQRMPRGAVNRNSTTHHRADIESRSIQRSKVMKKILAVFIFALAIYSVNAADKGKVVSLFDGKTFKGWEGDTNKTWRIENGALVGGSLKEKVSRARFSMAD